MKRNPRSIDIEQIRKGASTIPLGLMFVRNKDVVQASI